MSGTALGALIEATRATAQTLRVLADTLEAAANRASWAPRSSNPEQEVHTDTVDWDITNYATSSATPAPASRLSTNQAYELVASRIPPVPEHCIELCARLGVTMQDVRD